MSHAGEARPRQTFDPELRAAYLQLIERRFGLRLTSGQVGRLATMVERIWSGTSYASLREMLTMIESGGRADLLGALATELTIGETHFFRIGPQIDALRQVVLPELVARRASVRRLRIWSAGCSTGEEAFTLAILLREALPPIASWDIELLATDIDQAALSTARTGLFGEWSFRDTPNEIREQYFQPEGKLWRLTEVIRRMVRFEQQNLGGETVDSAPLASGLFDLIVCRNMTIYFTAGAAERLYASFATAQAPDGWLVLGPSDPTPKQGGAFAPAPLPGAVLWRRTDTSRAAPSHQHEPPVAFSRRTAQGQWPRVGPSKPLRLSLAFPARPSQTPAAGPEQIWFLEQQGNRAAARELAERLAREHPLEVAPHLLLGLDDLERGALDTAVVSLRRATFLDSRHALAHFSLGRAYIVRGDAARARAALVHAKRLLALVTDDEPPPGGGVILTADLRRAIDAQLADSTPLERR